MHLLRTHSWTLVTPGYSHLVDWDFEFKSDFGIRTGTWIRMVGIGKNESGSYS